MIISDKMVWTKDYVKWNKPDTYKNNNTVPSSSWSSSYAQSETVDLIVVGSIMVITGGLGKFGRESLGLLGNALLLGKIRCQYNFCIISWIKVITQCIFGLEGELWKL